MLGVGLYSLAGVYGKKDPVQIKRMIQKGILEGVDYFDVAPIYGNAEEFLGEVIKPYRSRVKIASKGGISKDGKPDGSYQAIINGCRESLRRLQTEYIDHYQVHFADPETPVEITIKALEGLKREGLIITYGLGHFSPEKADEFYRLGKPSSILLEISPLNINDYFRYQDFLQENKVAFIAMGVTGRGYLSGKAKEKGKFSPRDIRNRDPLFHPELEYWRSSVFEGLKSFGEKLGKSPIQVAINWVNSLKGVKRILVGPSSWEHLEENLGGLGWEMGEEERRELNNFIKEKSDEKEKIAKEKTIDFLGEEKPDFRNIIFVIETLFSTGYLGEEGAQKYFQKLLGCSHDQEKLKALQREIKADFAENREKRDKKP